MISLTRTTVAFIMMIGGVFFTFASVVGIIRFPDIYTRIHAGTKALSGGAVLILTGAALLAPTWQTAVKLLLVAAFLLATNPIASHAIARACYRHGFKPGLSFIDEYDPSKEEGEGY